RILLYPHEEVKKNYLSIYLTYDGDSSSLPTTTDNWSKTAKYKLRIKNYYYADKDKTL
ncbi:hypothetical protein HN51_023426, partial [Arachis hypogaea]